VILFARPHHPPLRFERTLATRVAPGSLALLLVSVASCVRDEGRSHVYRSSPPPAAAPAVAAPVAELPIGARGPSAQIVAVRLASTGAPAALDRVTEPVDVVALVSRGRGSSPRGPATLELRITGPIDTTLRRRLDGPVPIAISHVFRVAAGSSASGLPDGRFQVKVRLVGPAASRVAESVPVHLGVRSP
jgi:hypothetical protein